MEITAVVLLIVAGSEIFGWLITTTKIADQIVGMVLAITERPWLILLLVNIFLLVVGLAMEPVPCILILTPILLPLMERIGVDPIQFGVIMVLNLCIGLLTPPVGRSSSSSLDESPGFVRAGDAAPSCRSWCRCSSRSAW